jgi:hypothetical protein
MDTASIFIKFLQACITPVAMISGVGLLLLTITNRMARVVDRIRQLVNELDKIDVKRREIKEKQVKVFYHRAKLLRTSIAFIMIGMISSCLIIPLLFAMTLTIVDLRIVGYGLFSIAVISMFMSFTYFFTDVVISLMAIKLEAKHIL